jgi:cytosine/adenosine deaminase-related metal-dependent hydrolase
MLVLPGLIDAHNHPNQYLSKGIGDDVNILIWLRRVLAYEAHLTEEEAYLGALGNFVEMIRSGTTCFNEPGGYFPDAIGRAASQIGIRGILNRSTLDLLERGKELPDTLWEDVDTTIRRAHETVRRWNGAADGRLRAWYSLRHATSVSDRLAIEIKKLADEARTGLHCHAAVGAYENDRSLDQFGKRSLHRLHDLGLLSPNLYLVHMGAANEAEIDWLKHYDVKVAHCPSASMFGAYGVIGNKRIPEMIRKGVTVSLGTDSATAGRFLDMVRCMYLAACAHKDAYVDPEIMGAYKALEMATIDGAKACLWDDQIGSLEVGKLADLALIDMSGLDWKPCRDPIRNLVYGADGKSVDTVIVDGRVLMRHRVMTAIDEAWLKSEIEGVAARLMDRAGVKAGSIWPIA